MLTFPCFMQSVFMAPQVRKVFGTNITEVLFLFVGCPCVTLQTRTISVTILTILTFEILDTKMDRSRVYNDTVICSGRELTILTVENSTFMYRLNMSLKSTPMYSLIITLITKILDSFMFRLNMSLKMTQLCK